MNILIINGSLGGEKGNTSVLIDIAQKKLSQQMCNVECIHLENFHGNIENKLHWASGFIFTTGTYWDSWGSPLQKFLETTTVFEGSDKLLGKPAAVMISMHSVGGKEVLSRLQGVLNSQGLAIPPMTGLVYSLATHLALTETQSSFKDDFWCLDDVSVVIHNLLTYLNKKNNFLAWPVDHQDPKRRWLESK